MLRPLQSKGTPAQPAAVCSSRTVGPASAGRRKAEVVRGEEDRLLQGLSLFLRQLELDRCPWRSKSGFTTALIYAQLPVALGLFCQPGLNQP